MTVIDPQTIEVQISFTEPTTNSDGSFLNDLKQTVVTASSLGQPDKVFTYPATKATGGGSIIAKALLTAPDDAVTVFSFIAVAVDTQGKQSKMVSYTLTVSRVAPGSPQAFVVA